jgi:hypothetical protein
MAFVPLIELITGPPGLVYPTTLHLHPLLPQSLDPST